MGCRKLTYHQEPAIGASWKIFTSGKEKTVSTSNFCIDYYTYGMQMPGRTANTSDYRYGFQNQEVDGEIKGEGNSVNYKYRMHDPRIGRFFAVDPLAPKYPKWSPYAFSGNQVTASRELEGLEPDVDLSEAEKGKKYEGTFNGKLYDWTVKETVNSYDDDGNPLYARTWEMGDLIVPKDFRTSGDVASTDDDLSPSPDGSLSTPSPVEPVAFTASVAAELKNMPVAGSIISIASLDPEDPNPFDLLPFPGAGAIMDYQGQKWDAEIKEHGERGASGSWDNMISYARRYNTNEHTSVIFVYAAEDVHESLSHKVPTSTLYKTPEEAKAALGFKPTVVYYKFINENTKSLEVPVYNKLLFK